MVVVCEKTPDITGVAANPRLRISRLSRAQVCVELLYTDKLPAGVDLHRTMVRGLNGAVVGIRKVWYRVCKENHETLHLDATLLPGTLP